MRILRNALAVGALGLAAIQAQAAILLDYSPDATGATITPNGGSVWGNADIGQNFGEQIVFNTDVVITGMDIYSSIFYGNDPGKAVVVRTWDDLAGTPDVGSISQFGATITLVDSVGISGGVQFNYGRIFVDFGANAIQLAANTVLWIGISGQSAELGQLGISGPNSPGNGAMAQFSNTTFSHMATVTGDMAMRIHGTAGNVPDGGSLVALLGVALCGLVAFRRRQAA